MLPNIAEDEPSYMSESCPVSVILPSKQPQTTQTVKRSKSKSKSKSASKPKHGTKLNHFHEFLAKLKGYEHYTERTLLVCKTLNITASDLALSDLCEERFIRSFVSIMPAPPALDCHSLEVKRCLLAQMAFQIYTLLLRFYKITPPTNTNTLQSGTLRVDTHEGLNKLGSLAFIAPKHTQQIVDGGKIGGIESSALSCPRRLYQYLSWTLRVNKILGNVACFKNVKVFTFPKCPAKEISIEFVVVNIGLHSQSGHSLYALCVRNDVESQKAQNWQFVQLLDALEVTELIYGNPNHMARDTLPRSIRTVGEPFRSFMPSSKNQILAAGCSGNGARDLFGKFKSIETRYQRQSQTKPAQRMIELQVSLDEFMSCIGDALYSTDWQTQLIPILSISNKKKSGSKVAKEECFVDQLLPVQVAGNWLGVVFRNLLPVMLLFDRYDITNKAMLYDPTFRPERLSYFTSNILRIKLIQKQSPHYFGNPKIIIIPTNNIYTPILLDTTTSRCINQRPIQLQQSQTVPFIPSPPSLQYLGSYGSSSDVMSPRSYDTNSD